MPSFQVESLPSDPFQDLFSLSDEQLTERHIKRIKVGVKPGYPCRVSLEDAEVGENVLLFRFDHLNAGGFYDASGPIFVRENAKPTNLPMGTLPAVATEHRLFSVRAYDESGWMVVAQLSSGGELGANLELAFEKPEVSFIDVHNARPGCFAFRVRRAG